METNQEFKGYRGKTKTGSKKVKSKFDTPKPKTITPISGDTKIKIRKEDKKIRLESFWKKEQEIIPTLGEKKEQLSWRKTTKRAQRSFSKNKEKEYQRSKTEFSKDPNSSRKPFSNTFDKNPYTEQSEQKSSWNKNPVKPSTGFKKSKTGYQWERDAWDKSDAPRKYTRTWDDTRNTSPDTKKESNKSFPKPSFEKSVPKITEKKEIKREKYIAPVPSWEKEIKKEKKGNIKDPTK